MRIGFDNGKYLKLQAEKIRERIANFGGKLYLEFGGKLFDDYHASRVLPGFHPDSKITMLKEISDDVEVVIAITPGILKKIKFEATWVLRMTVSCCGLLMPFQITDSWWGVSF